MPIPPIAEYRGVIDDGTRKIPLVNTFGKLICHIYIRPADLSILDRYKQLNTDFKDIIEPLKGMSLKNDGTADFDADWQVLKSVENELKRRINALFDMEEADEIFAKRNPFSSVGGKFFCESVIEAIGSIIVQAVEDEMAQSKHRTDKYLSDLQPTAPLEVSGDDRTVTADT